MAENEPGEPARAFRYSKLMIRLGSLGPIGRAFENRDFLIFTMGNAPSQIGSWMQQVAIGWLTWQLTESATWLGIVVFANQVPSLLFAPLAGVFADRFDRLWVVRIASICTMFFTTLMAVLTATDLITIEILLIISICSGTSWSFMQPARQVLIRALVRIEDLPAAVAFTSTLWHTARFIGPALAGLLIVGWGISSAFFGNTLCSFMLVVALFRVRPAPLPQAGRTDRSMTGQFVEGLRYSISHEAIGPLLLIILCGALFMRPVTELLPGFAEGIYGRGAAGLAWMTSSAGLGAMFAGLWLAQRGTVEGLTTVTVTALLGGAVSVLAFALVTDFAAAVFCLALIGFTIVANATTILTLIQSSGNPEMHGRLVSLYAMFFTGGTAVGSLMIGTLADIFGLRAPPIGGALLCVAVWAWARGRQRRIERALEGG